MRTSRNLIQQLRWSGRAGTALALLLVLACGKDGDQYSPLPASDSPVAAVVAGTVRDAQKSVVADALVVIEPSVEGVPLTATLLAHGDDAANGPATSGRRVTTTGAGGSYAFKDVAPGDYYLQVIADDHLGAMQAIFVPAPEALLDTVYVDVNLTPA
ncbi:MAG: carboxypeptidase-like regulatory domain-containing protein, partial [Candidatus Krumholzibacteria bacterium]|nr:carboxypeptidase-like regulatory domain-containing protein [Candidatus Krumholzibacteria bacterium]